VDQSIRDAWRKKLARGRKMLAPMTQRYCAIQELILDSRQIVERDRHLTIQAKWYPARCVGLERGDCVVSWSSQSLQSESPRRPSSAEEDRTETLTARQVEILTWVQEGKTAWEIGRILDISGRSVDGHLRRIYARLDVRTRLQAVLRAQDLGFLVRRPRRP